jgi:selenide,water dikinase
LAEALKNLPQGSHPNLLVGFNRADDAGVYRINDDTALVQTVDFFPPIVDDPYVFGQIAAANALSDIYAMGGTPATAMNIVAFPKGAMPASILADILRGGQEKIEEAGAVVVGGHSINDKELKYGVAATGLIHPDRIITNSAAKPGDCLFLTKPLGTGLITTGIKRNAVPPELEELVSTQMARLNRTAAELMLRFGARAATDITGYGLMGHAMEVAEGSGVTIRIYSSRLPLIEHALEMAEQNMIPGGANANREFTEGHYTFEQKVDPRLEAVLFDPQTSGGLFIAVPADTADAMSAALKENGLPHDIIGVVEKSGGTRLLIE